MGLKDRIKRLERASREGMDSFELLDGSRYYFRHGSPGLFLHNCDCLKAGSAHKWPPPPEVVRKLTQAKDVEEAYEVLGVDGTFSEIVYESEILIRERRLVPRSLVSRYDPESGKHLPIDPFSPENEIKDLSEC